MFIEVTGAMHMVVLARSNTITPCFEPTDRGSSSK